MSVRTGGGIAPKYAAVDRLATGLAHMTPAERAGRGKQARAAVPRDSHEAFEPPPDRPDPIGLLEEQATSRVPELVPIRWGRMMVSPFTLLPRCGAADGQRLAGTPVSGLAVQACGDAHLSNFGVFGSAERRPGLRRQRLRRDAARPVGVGPQAAGRRAWVAARGNGFPDKDRRDHRHCHGDPVSAGDADLRRDDEPASLVRTHGRGRAARAVRRTIEKRQRKKWTRTWPRHGRGTACRRSPSCPASSTVGRGSSLIRR